MKTSEFYKKIGWTRGQTEKTLKNFQKMVESIESIKSVPTEVYTNQTIKLTEVELNVKYTDGTLGVEHPTKIICDTAKVKKVVATAIIEVLDESKSTVIKSTEFKVAVKKQKTE